MISLEKARDLSIVTHIRHLEHIQHWFEPLWKNSKNNATLLDILSQSFYQETVSYYLRDISLSLDVREQLVSLSFQQHSFNFVETYKNTVVHHLNNTQLPSSFLNPHTQQAHELTVSSVLKNTATQDLSFAKALTTFCNVVVSHANSKTAAWNNFIAMQHANNNSLEAFKDFLIVVSQQQPFYSNTVLKDHPNFIRIAFEEIQSLSNISTFLHRMQYRMNVVTGEDWEFFLDDLSNKGFYNNVLQDVFAQFFKNALERSHWYDTQFSDILEKSLTFSGKNMQP